jgi:hypothetical protein
MFGLKISYKNYALVKKKALYLSFFVGAVHSRPIGGEISISQPM